MSLIEGFDANQIEPTGDFEPIPAGTYLAVITDSEEKETKSGNGVYLQLTFQIIEGEHEGRLLWDRLNLDNPNKQAVEIARRTLSAICRAVNVLTPKAKEELHDIPLAIKVKQTTRKDTGEAKNEIAAYKAKDEVATDGGGGLDTAQAQSATPPWKRR